MYVWDRSRVSMASERYHFSRFRHCGGNGATIGGETRNTILKNGLRKAYRCGLGSGEIPRWEAV